MFLWGLKFWLWSYMNQNILPQYETINFSVPSHYQKENKKQAMHAGSRKSNKPLANHVSICLILSMHLSTWRQRKLTIWCKVLLSRDSLYQRVTAGSNLEMLPEMYSANHKHQSASSTYPASLRMVRCVIVTSSHGRDVQLVPTRSWGYFQILCSVDLVFTCSTF